MCRPKPPERAHQGECTNVYGREHNRTYRQIEIDLSGACGTLRKSVAPYSYSIIRFIAGAILVYHGYGKLFGGNIQGVADHVVTPLGLPMPLAFAYFLGILECFGGAALAIGFLTRPIALMLTVEFLHHHLLALLQRLQLLEPEGWLRISAGAVGPLRGDLFPRRRTAVRSTGCSAENFDPGPAGERRVRRSALLIYGDQTKTSAVQRCNALVELFGGFAATAATPSPLSGWRRSCRGSRSW